MDPTSEPAPQSQPRKRFQVVLLICTIILALIAIGLSIYILLNPHGPETPNNESFSIVTITERGIAPPTVTVKRGDSIIWSNQDAVPHKLLITSLNPPPELEGFGSDEAIAQGETYSFTFDTPGTFTYHDPTNPERIQGRIIVE